MSRDRGPRIVDFLARPVTLASFLPFGAWDVAAQLWTRSLHRQLGDELAPRFDDELRRLARLSAYVADGAADRERLVPTLDAIERLRLRHVVENGGVKDARHFHGMAEDEDGLPVVVPLHRRVASGEGER